MDSGASVPAEPDSITVVQAMPAGPIAGPSASPSAIRTSAGPKTSIAVGDIVQLWSHIGAFHPNNNKTTHVVTKIGPPKPTEQSYSVRSVDIELCPFHPWSDEAPFRKLQVKDTIYNQSFPFFYLRYDLHKLTLEPGTLLPATARLLADAWSTGCNDNELRIKVCTVLDAFLKNELGSIASKFVKAHVDALNATYVALADPASAASTSAVPTTSADPACAVPVSAASTSAVPTTTHAVSTSASPSVSPSASPSAGPVKAAPVATDAAGDAASTAVAAAGATTSTTTTLSSTTTITAAHRTATRFYVATHASCVENDGTSCAVWMMFTMLLLLRRQQHLIREMERANQRVLRKWAAIIIDTSTVPADTASLFRTTPSEAQEMRLKEVWKLSESNPTGIWQDLRPPAEPDTNAEKVLSRSRDYVTFAEGACLQDEWVTDPCVNVFIAIMRDRVQDASSPALATSFFSVKAAELARPTEVILKKVMKYLRNSNSEMVDLSSVSCLLISINLPTPGVHWGVLQVCRGWMTLFDGSTLQDASAKWGICVSAIDSFLALSPLPSLLCDWKCRGTQISASSLTQLLADASTPQNWSFGEDIVDQLRAEVVDKLQIRCSSSKDCETSLSLEYSLDVDLQRAAGQVWYEDSVIKSHTDNANSYLVAMRTPFTWGGYPEIQEVSEMLARPIIVYEHPVDNQFKLSSHVNSTANALPVILLRSNVLNTKSTHFQLMLPVVALKGLFDAVGYGPMLRAALSIVVVHPARITVSDGSQSTEFFVFGSQGDGNCLFRAIALFKLVSSHVNSEEGNFWSRQLPSIEVDLQKTSTDVERLWRTTAEIRNCAWSGKAVLDDSTVGGIMRLMRLLFLHCPSVADEKAVHLDAGHGLGVVQLGIIVGSKRTAIGVEQDLELHCFAKECDLHMLQKGGRSGKVAFRCTDLADFELDGVHVVHMYEAMAGNVHGDNVAHMAFVERLLQTPSVHVFTSTKLQSSLLKEYRMRSTIINEELTYSWVVVKVDGVRRRGNNPGSSVFMRWSGVLEGINLSEFESTTSNKSPVAELVQAAYQRSVGTLWSLTLDPSQKMSTKTSGEGYGETLNFLFGIFELDCHLTGLKLVTGCAVIDRRAAPRAHWLIGFATPMALSGFAPCTSAPVFLVLKNDSMLLQDQFAIIRQVDLIAVGTSTEAMLFQENDFRLAKEHFKAIAMSSRRSSRILRPKTVPTANHVKVAKTVPVSDSEFDSPPSKPKQQLEQNELVAELEKQLETLSGESKQALATSQRKIKSLQQAARRKTAARKAAANKVPVNSSSGASGPDDRPDDSGPDDSDDQNEKKPNRQDNKRPPSNTDAKNEKKPKKSGDTNVGPEQNGVSAALEERIAVQTREQTRELNHTMKQLLQEQHDNEKLKRDDVITKERDHVERLRYETLSSEVRGLKSHLIEQEKVSELKSLRQTNNMLAQSLADRDKSDIAARSSVLSNLKEARELMLLFQPSSQTGGNASQTGGNASQTGGNASQTGGNGNNHEYSAAGHSPQLPTEYPPQSPSIQPSWPTGYYAGHPPQWSTWYPPQSPSLQPSCQQWPNGYTPQTLHAHQSQFHQPPGPPGYPSQSPSHQSPWQQWPTGYSPQPPQSSWPSGPGYPPQPPSHQPQTAYNAGQPPSHQPGPGVEASGRQYPTSESARSRSSDRSRSPHSKSSSAVQYSRREIERLDSKGVQRWLHTNGVSTNDAAALTGRNGTLQDGYFLLSITQAEFMAQFPSQRSGELSLRVLWNKIDAMQQAR